MENIKNFLSLFGMFVFFVMSYDLFEIYKSNSIIKKSNLQIILCDAQGNQTSEGSVFADSEVTRANFHVVS